MASSVWGLIRNFCCWFLSKLLDLIWLLPLPPSLVSKSATTPLFYFWKKAIPDFLELISTFFGLSIINSESYVDVLSTWMSWILIFSSIGCCITVVRSAFSGCCGWWYFDLPKIGEMREFEVFLVSVRYCEALMGWAFYLIDFPLSSSLIGITAGRSYVGMIIPAADGSASMTGGCGNAS